MNNESFSFNRIRINLIANIISFVISFLISFFLTKYIVATLGSSVYSMVPIANNFITYFNLIVIALNSMSSRFVSLEIHKKDIDSASNYFSSIFFSNLIMAIFFLGPISFVIFNVDSIINIPTGFLASTQILFSFLFANFIVSLVMNVFAIAPYATNRLEIQSFISIISNVLRATITFLLFLLFKPSITFIGISVFSSGFLSLLLYFAFSKKLLPEMKISIKRFKIQYLKHLISAGIWASVSQLSAILLSGLSLLLSNLFIGADGSGTYALALTIPNIISGLIASLSNIFVPTLIYHYANNDIDSLVKALKRANSIISLFMCTIASAYIVFGVDFYRLWVPSENPIQLQRLTLIIISQMIVFACNASLFSVYTVINKLKVSSIVTLLTGVVSIIFTFILLNNTTLGLYAIPITSSVLSLLVNAIFHPIYVAMCLDVKKTEFFPQLIKGIIAIGISVTVALLFKSIFSITSWGTLFISGIITIVPIILIVSFVILGKSEIKTKIIDLKRILKVYKL